jgi:hypothetical protein
MEIKFDSGFASWLQAVIKRHNLIRTSVSKYGSCLGACAEIRPMLPRRMMEAEREEVQWRKEVAI